MIGVVALLLAFPLGYFVRSRLTANAIFAIAYLWAFTYQTHYLHLGLEHGVPQSEKLAFPLAYGLVTFGVFLVGFAAVAAGWWLADRRRAPEAAEPAVRV